MKEIIENYKKYKWFLTSSGKLVIGGKNSAQNDELLRAVLGSKKQLIIMHTSSPGSPFSVIMEDPEKIKKEDLEECSIFTACFSQAWKSGANKAAIDIFKASQLYKNTKMKEGTWGVNGVVETVIVPLELILIRQKGILRAVPAVSSFKKSDSITIIPGKITKEDLSTKLALELGNKYAKEELLSALPSGGFKVLR